MCGEHIVFYAFKPINNTKDSQKKTDHLNKKRSNNAIAMNYALQDMAMF